ncbi:hypothetical protein BDZ97DRAFT_545983 [Flammula alnicola]|nr:hypothetical protein BDZ97DRAFT_545983 [Flammula alnicola]
MAERSRKPSDPQRGSTASTSRSEHGKPTSSRRPTNSHGHEDDRYEGEREERALIHQIWVPPDDTSRPPHLPTGPIRTSNDVGRYPPEQQHPFSQHTMAPLGHHPQYSGGPPPVLQGVNSQSGNSSASSVTESYNKRRVNVGSGASMQLGSNTSSSTILNIQAQALHVSVGHHPSGGGSFPLNHQLDAIAPHPPATRPSVDYHGTSSHFTPPMRNPIPDRPSYEQPIDTRLRLPSNTDLDYRNARPPDQTRPPLRMKDVPALHPSRDREQEKPWGDSDERWSGSKAEDNIRRTRPSGHAINSTRNPPPPTRSDDSFPRGPSFGGAPSPPEGPSSQGGWVSTQDVEAFQRPKRVQEGPWPAENVNNSWITSEDALPSHQKPPSAFPSVNQNLLPSASSDNSTRRIPVGSAPPPPVRQSSQGSSWHNINNRDVENVPWDRTREEPRLETGGGWFGPKDDGHSQRSPPSAYSSTSPGNMLSSSSSSDDSSRRVPPLGGPPPPVRQTSQGGSWHNLKNPDVQVLPRDRAIEEPRLETGDRGWRPKDDGHSHRSPPSGHSSSSGNHLSSSSSNDSTRGLPSLGGGPPPAVRQSSQGGGGAWHDIQNTQPLPRDRGQEENTDRRWVGHSRDGPSQQNPAGGYGNTSSRNPAPTARSTDKITQIPASVGPQPPPGQRQMAPEAWQNPSGTNSASSSSWLPESMPTGLIYPSPNHPPPGHPFRYQQELGATQQMMARTSLGPPARKLTTIEESQIYHTATSHASYSSISTIPDKPKVQSIGYPSLIPFQRKKDIENWIHKKSSTDHIPLYMESKIVDDDTMPLWYPSPTLRSCNGTLRGVEAGDLGYLDESGEFHCLFNIFQSFEANNAAGAIPPPPSHHRHLQVDPRPFIKQVDIQQRCVYLSDNIRRVDDSRSKTFYEFSMERRSGRKAAIIVLPHGGSSSTLRAQFFQLPEVKQYFLEHAASWYQHAIARHIPNISNGSLLFVHGTHCARTWGIAAFTSKNDVKQSIHARFSANSNNRFEYQWDTPDNKWKIRAGPSARELDALRGEKPPMNQCIGVIISSLRLDEETWQTYFPNNDRSPTSDRTASRGRDFSITRMLTRMSSMSSIHVNQRPTGRRYAASLLENQGGVHYAADNYELLRREFV